VEDREMDLYEYVELYVHEDHCQEIITQFNFLELNSKNKLPKAAQCSADILQFVAEAKLAMQPHDKDMIVMLHEIEYEIQSKKFKVQSSLKVVGTDNLQTAMAKTVGVPLGIAAKLILNGTIQLTGLQIPTSKEIYEPVLMELQQHDISFTETAINL
jgi:saccharopine dehydrogenase (NADP+, L-glutamate forming)